MKQFPFSLLGLSLFSLSLFWHKNAEGILRISNFYQQCLYKNSGKDFIKTLTSGSEYTVLEFQFQPVKCTVVTKLQKNSEQLFFPIQAIQGDQCVDVNNPLQKVFKRVYTLYNYSNQSINHLLYC